MKTRAQRRREREAARLERLLGPPGFRDFMKRRACDACGRMATERVPNEMHHEPPEGMSRRGHWTKTCTLCRDCHTAGGDARHNDGVESFWERVGKDPADVIQAAQDTWAELQEGMCF